MEKIKVGVIVENHPYDIMEFQEMLWSFEECECYVQPFDLFVQDDKNQEQYDVLLFYNMDLPLPEQGSAAHSYLTDKLGKNGQGIVLLHHSLLSYPKWDLWTQVSGVKVRCEDGVFEYHQNEAVCEHIEVCGHPITDGLEDFTLVDETYIIGEPQEEGNTILITTNNPVSIKNIAWVRQYEKSRVFCYASGHDGQSYKDVSFRKVLKKGILWSINRLH